MRTKQSKDNKKATTTKRSTHGSTSGINTGEYPVRAASTTTPEVAEIPVREVPSQQRSTNATPPTSTQFFEINLDSRDIPPGTKRYTKVFELQLHGNVPKKKASTRTTKSPNKTPTHVPSHLKYVDARDRNKPARVYPINQGALVQAKVGVLESCKPETGVVLRVPRIHEEGFYIIKFGTSTKETPLHHTHFKVLNNDPKKPCETTVSTNKEEERPLNQTAKSSISKPAVDQDAKVIDLTQDDQDNESTTSSFCEIVEAPVIVDAVKTASGGKKANE